ncbi:SOS response associated peptidase (SRAP) [Chitinophaga sp. CF118]|uniref:SOS response-associated peptidase n=1 Tax=Chitinophaga sp. CF118 TaxID=1884367 RepID=UPI0008E1017E|nr:SOS response-associated peptidase family protein [Chitinophaga sp. CF118]SFD46858.1 SOS response associated peptidase (SRAP) [Chitinophaga sp. CF118]
MCYDISFNSDILLTIDAFPTIINDLKTEFDKEALIHVEGHRLPEFYTIYTTNNTPHLTTMAWGVDPLYISDLKERLSRRAGMLNARSERILDDHKSYWYRIKDNRCLIPVTGIYEHRQITGWKNKVPYLIQLQDAKIFYIPGLYQLRDEVDTTTGEIFRSGTYTVITRPANALMGNIHNSGENKHRMPLFITTEIAQQWINPALTTTEVREILAYEIPSDNLACKTVYSIRGGKHRPDNKDKDAYWEWANLPSLGNDNPLNMVSQQSLF